MRKLLKLTLFIIPLGLFSCKAVEDGLGLKEPDQYARVYIAAAYNGPVSREMSSIRNDTLKVYANYSGVRALSSDVEVELKTDLSLIDAFNERNGTSYSPPAPECYLLKDKTVTIPSGQSISSSGARLVLIAGAFMDDELYLLPVSIASISRDITVNEDLRTLYVLVRCKGGIVEINIQTPADYTVEEEENW